MNPLANVARAMIRVARLSPMGMGMRVVLVFVGALLAGCGMAQQARWSIDESRPAWMPAPEERYYRAPLPAAAYRDGLA